jgi:hypothetical protein
MSKKKMDETTGFETFTDWQEAMAKGANQMDALYDEVGRRHLQVIEQTNSAISEMTKMAQDSLSFTSALSQEWLKAARGTSKWATDLTNTWTR